MDFEAIIRIINLIIGTLVAIIAAVIAILTYKKAKDTILQPMKNEVFKLQINELTLIMDLIIYGHGVKSVWEIINIEKIIDWNSFVLIDAFLIIKGGGSKIEDRPYNKENSINWMGAIPPKTKQTTPYFIIPEYVYPAYDYLNKEFSLKQQWRNYEHLTLMIPIEVWKTREVISKLCASPVLPTLIIEKLNKCLQLIDEDLAEIKQTLTHCSKHLLQYIDLDLDQIPEEDLLGFSNFARNTFIEYQPDGNFSLPKDIVECVRDYLGSDKILKK